MLVARLWPFAARLSSGDRNPSPPDLVVNLRAGKQWASTAEEEAIDQLYWRKCCQVRILESRLDEAKAAKEVLEKHFGKKPRAPRRYSGEYDYY